MYLKIHENSEGRIVAVCDKELLGKVLESGKIHMDLEKNKEFYMGEHVKEEDVKAALKQFTSANLVGEKAVGVALFMEIAEKEDIIYINEVPHIQIYKI